MGAWVGVRVGVRVGVGVADKVGERGMGVVGRRLWRLDL